ncbi:MAG: response regulator [Deltaproteobacteria bacterium]|jgi:FixJ family two-component response regulator|nr:response regulator [Deltaproteobacteria bacterium]MBT4641091.1 response regulator [Deltaproteobacteria bacterium]MBT7152229.1 response regulator [Deltaproteobacteria bacterium]
MENKKTIICIDDEEVILNSLEMGLTLNDAEFEIETAMGGPEALELIDELIEEKAEIAVVITDYIMPVMKGDEVLIKIHEKLPAVSKILLTGQSQIEGVTNAINKADLFRFIEKPWRKEDLLLTIKGAIQKYDTEKKLREQQKVIDDLNSRLNDSKIEISDSNVTEEQLFNHSLFVTFFKSLNSTLKIWFGHACVGIMSADGRISKSEMLYVNTLCSANPKKEYVYQIVKLLKSKGRPKLGILKLPMDLTLNMMRFFVQVTVNDGNITQHEQRYLQYLGGRLSLNEQTTNDFIRLAYQKIEVVKKEKGLMEPGTGESKVQSVDLLNV